MPYTLVDGYITWTPDGVPPIVTAEDGTDDTFSPLAVTTWSPTSESANRVEQLIDGTIAVTLLGDLPRTGQLTFIVDDDATAEAGRTFFARKSAFTLEVPDRPIVNMTFVRQGGITAAIHDEARQVWEFSVGFQEILP